MLNGEKSSMYSRVKCILHQKESPSIINKCIEMYAGSKVFLFFRNELPEFDDIELSRGIGEIDIMDETYHVPMKSWGMSVSATNINCVDNIFRSKLAFSFMVKVKY